MLTMAEVKDKQQPVCTQSVKTPVCSLGREGQRGLTSACFSCIPDSESYALSSSLLIPRPLCSSVLDWDRRQGAHSPKQEMRVYLTETEEGTTDQGNGDPNPQSPSCYSPVEQLAVSLMERILRDVGTEMDDRQVTMVTEMAKRQVTMVTEMDMSWSSSSSSDEETGGPHTESPCEGGPAIIHSRLKEQEEGGGSEEDDPDLRFYDGTGSIHGDRQGLGEFKEFLKGTPGEKLLRLWMDIERLNTLQDGRRKNRHLVQMRSCYLLTSDQSSLNGELLTRLGLSTSPCWREDRLQRAQPRLTEALLCYWGPRFRLSQRAADPLRLSLWRKRPLCYPSGVNPNPRYTTLHPLTCIPRPTICPDTSLPRDRTPTPGHTDRFCQQQQHQSCSRGQEDGEDVAGPHVDSRAGFYFTHYCERSRNQTRPLPTV
ncbi:uncharacterized protein LOC121585431 [Coregonus clupeaformis]|uniref:uncharacterized protein LOC121585431 n=1 Tax=Coregonus clupeaformis TaxID=59861 RepID=UPI001E1C76B7|nr:uncharacterized protein LOC121585431 [Coregonus clupeaformis]